MTTQPQSIKSPLGLLAIALAIVVAILAIVLVIRSTDITDAGSAAPDFAGAYDTCIDQNDDRVGHADLVGYIRLADEHTITAEVNQGRYYTASVRTVACLFDQLDTGAGLRNKVATTTLAAGVQSDSEDGIEYTWSLRQSPYGDYVNGLDLTIEG